MKAKVSLVGGGGALRPQLPANATATTCRGSLACKPQFPEFTGTLETATLSIFQAATCVCTPAGLMRTESASAGFPELTFPVGALVGGSFPQNKRGLWG